MSKSENKPENLPLIKLEDPEEIFVLSTDSVKEESTKVSCVESDDKKVFMKLEDPEGTVELFKHLFEEKSKEEHKESQAFDEDVKIINKTS